MPNETDADPAATAEQVADATVAAGEGIRQTVDLDTLSGLLQARGFRAERVVDQDNRHLLRSATGGIAFHVRPGNPAEDDRFLDFSYLAVIQLEAPAPPEAIAEWNAAKRFARLYARERWVVLEMDVLVAGGVAPQYLGVTLEVWDRLLHELVAHLRSALALPRS